VEDLKDCIDYFVDEIEKLNKQLYKSCLDFKEVEEQNKRLCEVLEELISVVEIQDGADDTTGDLYLALKIAKQELELNEKLNNERD
jgi:hypothetical protein